MNTLKNHPLEIAEKIEGLNNEYKRRFVSKDLQILGPYLELMESFAALRTANKNVQPLALSLITSSIGLFASTSPIGIIGPNLEKIFTFIASVIDILYKEQTPGNKRLLKNSTAIITTFMMTCACIAAKQGTAGRQFDDIAQNEINSFSLELLVLIGIYSEAPLSIFETVAETCGYPEASAKSIANVITAISILLVIRAICRERGPEQEVMLKSITPFLQDYLLRIGDIIEKNMQAQILDREGYDKLTITIKQLDSALKTERVDDLITSINDGLKILNIKPAELEADINSLMSESSQIIDHIKQTTDSEMSTQAGIWQAG